MRYRGVSECPKNLFFQKFMKNNIHNIASFWGKYAQIFFLGHFLFLKSPQFSSSCAFGKLFSSGNTWCPRTNIRGYLHSKWGIFLLYIFVEFRGSKRFPQDSSDLKADLGISESYTKTLPCVDIHNGNLSSCEGKRSGTCLLKFPVIKLHEIDVSNLEMQSS